MQLYKGRWFLLEIWVRLYTLNLLFLPWFLGTWTSIQLIILFRTLWSCRGSIMLGITFDFLSDWEGGCLLLLFTASVLFYFPLEKIRIVFVFMGCKRYPVDFHVFHILHLVRVLNRRRHPVNLPSLSQVPTLLLLFFSFLLIFLLIDELQIWQTMQIGQQTSISLPTVWILGNGSRDTYTIDSTGDVVTILLMLSNTSTSSSLNTTLILSILFVVFLHLNDRKHPFLRSMRRCSSLWQFL